MIQKRTTEPSKNSVHAPWIHAAGILTALWLMIVRISDHCCGGSGLLDPRLLQNGV